MKKIAVIGAGPMGLACAYELLKHGYDVDVYEADDRVGGMSAHFDFNGISIERYYHFICKPDKPMFDLLDELGLSDKLQWRETRMGYFYDGKLYNWGNPLALLKFSPISLIDRLRYGLHMFYCTKVRDWSGMDRQEASAWIKKWEGERAYNVLWKKLFELKFHRYTGNLSASWIWARIRRVGQSRKSIFKEQLGYLKGGSETLLTAMEEKIRELGGRINLSRPVQKVVIENKQARGINVEDELIEYDSIISTIPLPFVPRMIPDLPADVQERYRSINNIGVVCVLLKLKKPVTGNFWLNINDSKLEVPGMIEMSNLRPLDYHLAYIPFYLPRDNKKFENSNSSFILEAENIVKSVNPELTDEDIIDIHVSRYGFAQPICPPEFKKNLPPVSGVIEGLHIADTSYYYPEDRSISESVDLGRKLASLI
jgi:protoporphyrinogen oxidase